MESIYEKSTASAGKICINSSQIKSSNSNNDNLSTSDNNTLLETSKNETDLTDAFFLADKGEITGQDVENYIVSLLGELYETASDPLFIQIAGGRTKLKHIASKHENQKKGRAKRRNAAIILLEEIINNATYDSTSDVDLGHNSKQRTLNRKATEVKEYVYFNSPARIGNGEDTKHFNIRITTERIKKQDPNLLDLYYLAVKEMEPSNRNFVVALPPDSN